MDLVFEKNAQHCLDANIDGEVLFIMQNSDSYVLMALLHRSIRGPSHSTRLRSGFPLAKLEMVI